MFKCWICDYSGTRISQLLRKHAPSSYVEYRNLEGEIDLSKYDSMFSENISKHKESVNLPDNFQTLTGKKTQIKKKPLEYLYSRGFDDEDILRWKIGFCDYGEYQSRIIIPSFDEFGDLNYFIGRTYIGNWMKYKNPQISKDVIFNDLNIDWESDIILVEGVFDAMKCDNAIPLLGSTLKENSNLFEKICKKKSNIYLALDTDAKDKEFIISKKLKEYGIKTMSIDTAGYSDVGEMTKQELIRRKQTAAFISDLDYLNYKLNF